MRNKGLMTHSQAETVTYAFVLLLKDTNILKISNSPIWNHGSGVENVRQPA